MAKEGVTIGMSTDISILPPICQFCILGKQMKKIVPKMRQGGTAGRLLEVIYVNLIGPEDGPEDVASVGGAKYIRNLVDDLSGMTWTHLIKEKSQAEKSFVKWCTLMENESGQQVKCLQTDNGGEFTSVQFKSHLCQWGIQHQMTALYTSAQNGHVECMHHMIMDRARAIHADLDLPPNIWGECVVIC